MQLSALEVLLVEFGKATDSTFGLLVSDVCYAKRLASAALSKRYLDPVDLTVLAEEVSQLILGHLVRQIHHVESFLLALDCFNNLFRLILLTLICFVLCRFSL